MRDYFYRQKRRWKTQGWVARWKEVLLGSCRQKWGWGLLGMLKQQLHGGQQEWDPSLFLPLSLFCWAAEGEDGRKLLCMVCLTSIPLSLFSLSHSMFLSLSLSPHGKQRCRLVRGRWLADVRVFWLEMERREAEESWCDGGLWSKLYMTTLLIHGQRLTHNDWRSGHSLTNVPTKITFIYWCNMNQGCSGGKCATTENSDKKQSPTFHTTGSPVLWKCRVTPNSPVVTLV